MRLDTLCFTLGFAKTIRQARQLVNHGHITINGKVLNIPSFQCRLNDVISVRNKSVSKNLIKSNLQNNQRIEIPYNLEFNVDKLEATILDYCDRNTLLLPLDELLVIEYYSLR